MERILENLLNNINKKQVKLLFGDGSYFKIEKINWLTQQKCHQITLTLHCSDLELTKDAYPDGVEYLVRDAWDLICYGDKFIIVSSLKLV